jgi:gamma-glutamylcysteine synthetase
VEAVTVVVSALAAGAAGGLRESAVAAVKDAYAALRSFIAARYAGVDLAPVERTPASAADQESLAEDLAAAGAAEDAELLAAARVLLAAIRAHEPAAGPAAGVDLERVEAAALRIHDVRAAGGGVRVRDGRFAGDIDISGVSSGDRPPEHP